MKNKMINVLCFCCGFVLYNGCNLKSCENFWNMSDNVYIYVFVILEIEICLNIKLYCLLNIIIYIFYYIYNMKCIFFV